MEIKDHSNYLIYPDGRIYSKIGKGRFLKYDLRRGYFCLCLGKKNRKLVHRLVAEHYIPNPDNKPEVDHIDRNKLNNNVNNLRWATKSENQINRSYPVGKSGHRNISYHSQTDTWCIRRQINKKTIRRCFKNKIQAICYKYILLLKIKSKLI